VLSNQQIQQERCGGLQSTEGQERGKEKKTLGVYLTRKELEPGLGHPERVEEGAITMPSGKSGPRLKKIFAVVNGEVREDSEGDVENDRCAEGVRDVQEVEHQSSLVLRIMK